MKHHCTKCDTPLICPKCVGAEGGKKGGKAKGRKTGFSDPAVRTKAARIRAANRRAGK